MTLGVIGETVPQLLRRHATVSRPCCCGEPVVADSIQPGDVWLAVRRHNVGQAHTAWRARMGIR